MSQRDQNNALETGLVFLSAVTAVFGVPIALAAGWLAPTQAVVVLVGLVLLGALADEDTRHRLCEQETYATLYEKLVKRIYQSNNREVKS